MVSQPTQILYPNLSEVGVWFNMMMADWSAPIMVVEGELDCMRLINLGFMNVVASCTSSVTDAQIDSLTAETVILGFDSDKAGEHACARVRDRLRGRVAMYRAEWLLAMKSEGVPCKDPGDLPNKEALNKVMSNLEEVK
jgi:DNA primase